MKSREGEKSKMIEEYSFGSITVDGTKYRGDIVVYPDKVDESWWRKEGHEVCMDDITTILESGPEVLIFGKGKPGLMKVPPFVKAEIERKGIEVYVLSSQAAIDKYNEICEDKKTVLAIHLTC